MKNYKFHLADFVALFLLIIKIFAPFFVDSLKLHTLTMVINSYIIGYLAYIISFKDTNKVLLMALPLVIYSLFMVFFIGDFNINFDKGLMTILANIFTNIFDVISVVFGFFILELALSRLLGSMVTNILAGLGLILYLVMHVTDILLFDIYYDDALVYFAFYVMATRIVPANSLNIALYPLAILVFVGEAIAYSYFNFYPGLYFSVFFITYLLLKDTSAIDGMSIEKYLAFSYLYPYHVLAIVFGKYINASGFVIVLLASLATFAISEIFYKLNFKFLNYLYIGID